jgi:hypothetical protein
MANKTTFSKQNKKTKFILIIILVDLDDFLFSPQSDVAYQIYSKFARWKNESYFYVHSFLDEVGSPNLFDLSSYSKLEKQNSFLS